MDFLTFTADLETAKWLRSETEINEPGYGGRGFGKSEQRVCVGGRCWRRWEPVSESKRFEKDYESWEWSGGESDLYGRRLRGREGYPTRIDVCWDYSVSDDLDPCTVVDQITGWCADHGITLGIAGQDGVVTRYVGSAQSDRRIRIYRKDRQDEAVLFQMGYVLRVELILRAELAKAWWMAWERDELVALRVAAGHVREMTGRDVQADALVPLPVVAPEVEWAMTLWALISQHGPTIAAFDRAGFDILGLAAMAEKYAAPRTQRRWERSLKELRSLDVAGISEMIGDRFRGKVTMAAGPDD